MKKKQPDSRPVSVEAMRSILLTNYQLVIHDLNCGCDKADPSRALNALAMADWSLLELAAHWYDWWLTRD